MRVGAYLQKAHDPQDEGLVSLLSGGQTLKGSTKKKETPRHTPMTRQSLHAPTGEGTTPPKPMQTPMTLQSQTIEKASPPKPPMAQSNSKKNMMF